LTKIHVERLGKVRAAELTTAPLMLLVGKNNTGKSYVATLLWTLSNLFQVVSSSDEKRPTWWDKFVRTAKNEKAATIELNSERQAALLDWLNRTLASQSSSVLSNAFAYPGFDATRVSLSANEVRPVFSVAITTTETGDSEKKLAFFTGTLSDAEGEPVYRFRMPMLRPNNLVRTSDRIFFEAVCRSAFGPEWSRMRNSVYIPAARTGLMLAFRSLVAQSLDVEDDGRALSLPAPLQDFLQRLAYSNVKVPVERSSLIDWLQRQVLHGAIEASSDEIPAFSYRGEGMDVALPLHATSSMITEMAPFLLVLNGRFSTGVIIFEEPEAHLHLSAQRDMARAIARLVNSGMRLVITTHSDTFLQQINNLMALHKRAEDKEFLSEFGYEGIDLIDPDIAVAYEFSEGPEGTEIVEVVKSDDGFIVKSLNETLISLARETIDLSEE